jgi:hypothetical protein
MIQNGKTHRPHRGQRFGQAACVAIRTLACLLLLSVSAPSAQRPCIETRLRQTTAANAARSELTDEPLAPGSQVAGELRAGARRQYRITMAANQDAELFFEPGAFLCAHVFQPDGKELIKQCHASSVWSLKLSANTSGDNRLVLSQQYPAYAIQYRVRLSELKRQESPATTIRLPIWRTLF